MRKLLILLLGTALAALLLFLIGVSNARRMPIVRTTRLELPDWPSRAKPVRVLLMSDIHLGSMAMDAGRLRRIVDQAVALHPDMILLAGDFIEGHIAATARAQAPDLTRELKRLHAPLGVIAVLGNHDYSTDPEAVAAALTAANITVLRNAAALRGPIVVGGIDDQVTRHDDVPGTLDAMDELNDEARRPGAGILINHAPNVVYQMRREARLIFAGHTHCGQIALGPFGPIKTIVDGETFMCGLVREGNNRLIVTAGLGTSVLPLRYGVPPDMWLVTLGPAASR